MYPSVSFPHRIRLSTKRWILALVIPMTALSLQARDPEATIAVWPAKPPGDLVINGPERKVEGRPRPFYQLTGIAEPSISVFLPPAASRNGTAVLVCPGGGLQRVAYEHEGLEVAEWLNSLNITAFILKYRAPAPALNASQDAQRALSVIRQRASEWQVDPQAIGILGFSAGGEIATWLATHGTERLYPATDPTDAVSCRPDFVGVIYPGGLLRPDGGGLKEPLLNRVQTNMPPVFIAHAFNDASDNSLQLALAMKRAGVPVELHLYQEGGHGVGARRTGVPISGWKNRFGDWLGSQTYLDPLSIRRASSATLTALLQGQAPPRFIANFPNATLDDAYQSQRRFVRQWAQLDPIAGFKGAAASAAAQTALGIDRPLAGVVFQKGRLDASKHHILTLRPDEEVVVETEIGYITSVDLSYEVLTDDHARGAVESIVPLIELPRSYPGNSPATARDSVAMNIGSDRYIVGRPIRAEGKSPDTIPVSLRRDGQVLHETTGGSVNGGQWTNLRHVLNELTRHGYTIPAGSVILGGALGKIHPGQVGRYAATFGELGGIEFELRR